MFFEGTQRGLFSLLYGAGIAIMTTSLGLHAQDVFFRRSLWLIVFGLIHGFVLLWIGDILFFYGATALFVYGFRNAAPRTLMTIAFGGLLFNAGWNLLDTRSSLKSHKAYVAADFAKQRGDTLTPRQTRAIEKWEGRVKEHTPDSTKIAEELEVMRGGYWGIAKHQAPQLTYLQPRGMYRYFFDGFSMMLLGIAAFRLGVITAARSAGTYALLVVIGYGVGLAVNYWEVSTILGEDFSLVAFQRARVTYDIGRLFMTLGHLGVIMLFCKSGVLPWLQRGLSALGRMALTNYVMHSVICAFLFYGFGLGLYGTLSRHELYYVVGAIWMFQLMVSPLWLARYRFGPLEYLWRWLSYGERPALRVGRS